MTVTRAKGPAGNLTYFVFGDDGKPIRKDGYLLLPRDFDVYIDNKLVSNLVGRVDEGIVLNDGADGSEPFVYVFEHRTDVSSDLPLYKTNKQGKAVVHMLVGVKVELRLKNV